MLKFRSNLSALTALSAVLCLVTFPLHAAGEGWTDDYEAAKKQAAEENKDMLLDFTGSDWCGWCIKLVNEVFSKDEFKAYADQNLVLVEIDFPRDQTKLSDETKAQNNSLKDAFGIRGYPTIYLTDAQGRPYARTGYQRGGPEVYVAHLQELKKIRTERDGHFAAAEKAQGIEKARHLHSAMQVLGDEMPTTHYKPIIEEIIALDANNEAGLKKHYADIELAKQQRNSIEQAMRTARTDPAGSIQKLGELAADEETVLAIKQEALALKSRIQLVLIKDKPAAKATLIEAIEVDPESDMGKMLKQALDQTFSEDA